MRVSLSGWHGPPRDYSGPRPDAISKSFVDSLGIWRKIVARRAQIPQWSALAYHASTAPDSLTFSSHPDQAMCVATVPLPISHVGNNRGHVPALACRAGNTTPHSMAVNCHLDQVMCVRR